MGGGETTTTQNVSYDPTLQALNTLRLNLAQQTATGGLPASMTGFIQNMLIPSTVNQMTAAGLGRSGAVGEAVSGAVLGQGTNFITSLLGGGGGGGGVPSGGTTSTQPGAADWISLVAPILVGLAACHLARALFGGETFQTTVIRSWLFRHPWLCKVYARFGPRLVPVAPVFRPVFARIIHRELRGLI